MVQKRETKAINKLCVREKKTVLMQNVGNTFKVHYGRCASGVCLAGFLKTLPPDGPSGETAFFRQKISPK